MDHAEEPNELTSTASTASTTTPLLGPWEYMVGGVIGEGSFGRVVYGQHKETGQDVAIKVVDLHSCRKHPMLVASLRREQTILRQLLGEQQRERDQQGHFPLFIVQLLASFVDTQCVYIVMECCTGGTLQELIQFWHSKLQQQQHQQESEKQQRRTSGDRIFLDGNELLLQQQQWSRLLGRYTSQILKALNALHLHGYIHADLNPSNVLLTGDRKQQVRLADFSSALSLNDDVHDETEERLGCPWQMTTTDYACPELLKGKMPSVQERTTTGSGNIDDSNTLEMTRTLRMIAVDVWSLGCLIFAGWRGQSPFHAASDALAIQAIQEYSELQTRDAQRQWLIDSESAAIGMDEEWLALVHNFLSPDPEHRFCSANHDTVCDCISASMKSNFQNTSRDDWINKIHERLCDRQKLKDKPGLGDSEGDDDDDDGKLHHLSFLSVYEPSWWVKQQQEGSHGLRDGAAEGWAAFLL